MNVPAMGMALASLRVRDHYGTLMVKLTVLGSVDPDLTLAICHRAKLDEDNYTWCFRNCKQKMTLDPKKVFNDNLLTEKEKKTAIDYKQWQPEYIYLHFTSNAGGDFCINANFIDEELTEQRKTALAVGKGMEHKFMNALKFEVH